MYLILSPSLWFDFYLLNKIFQGTEILNFDQFQYINVSPMVRALCVLSKKSLPISFLFFASLTGTSGTLGKKKTFIEI